MQGIPWRTIALGSLMLISICSKGGQEVQSPQSETSKPPVKMEQRGRILGIGGVFFKSANRDQMREWYSKHLGLADKGAGANTKIRRRNTLPFGVYFPTPLTISNPATHRSWSTTSWTIWMLCSID
jgi:hypothetical protein